MPITTAPPPPLPVVTTLDDVVEALDTVIQWSMGAASRLGYFAALYKRITVAVRQAIAQGAFQDGPRMERFDVTFAARYLDALNGHFHPGDHPRPTRCWQVSFDAAQRQDPILLQHMLAGVNAHIDLDLGIAATQIACGTGLSGLQEDFDRINAVLASQVNGLLTDVTELSPAMADVAAVLMGHEIFVINEAVRVLRDSAWRFAVLLCAAPAVARPLLIWTRDRKVAGQGRVIYDPPSLTGVLATAVRTIAAQESRDVVHNIGVLDEIASAPAPIRTVL
ncbi:MAG: DUF5995 family protein [Mycobacterium sp.]